MPNSAQITVGTTATLLVPANIADQMAYIHNHEHGGGNPVLYIGNASVTAANGYELDAGDSITIGVGDHEALYGIAASGTVKVSVLYQVN
jgi:hypothetical protein